jgi:hypothetical protein
MIFFNGIYTSFCNDIVSHIRTVLSNDPDASIFPHGENCIA